MYCEKCGRKREAGAAFCMGCGSRFTDERKTENKGKLPLIIVGVVSLLLIIGLIVLAVILITGNNSSKNTSNNNVIVEESEIESETQDAHKNAQIETEEENVAKETLTENATEISTEEKGVEESVEAPETIEQEQPIEASEAIETEQEIVAEEPAVESWQAYYYRKFVIEDVYGLKGDNEVRFYFVNIDNDNIPEIIVDYSYDFSILTYCNGNSDTLFCDGEDCIEYIERGQLIAVKGGRMDHYYIDVYSLENGKFSQVGYGTKEFLDPYWEQVEYSWNGETVDGTEYDNYFNSMLPENEKTSFSPDERGMPYDVFCSRLEAALAAER